MMHSKTSTRRRKAIQLAKKTSASNSSGHKHKSNQNNMGSQVLSTAELNSDLKTVDNPTATAVIDDKRNIMHAQALQQDIVS